MLETLVSKPWLLLQSLYRQIRDMPRQLAWLLLAAIIANTAGSAYYPFLPLYLESLGATVEQVGLFFTVQTIMAIVFRIFGGWISDNLGRLQAIAISGVFGVVALGGFALARSWEWAIIGALFGSIGGALHGPSFHAYTAEAAPEGETARTFGLVEGLYQICQIIGPALGGFLVETTSYRVLLWTVTGIFGVAALLRVWMARNSRFQFRVLKPTTLVHNVRTIVLLLVGGGLITWLFIIDSFQDTGFQMAFPFIPKYITEVGQQSEGVYGSLRAELAVMAALFTWLGGILADRYGERWGIGLGSLLQSAALFVMMVFSNITGFVVGFALFGIGMSFAGPAVNSLMSKAVPRKSLGMMFGLFRSALGVAAIPAPYIGGYLYINAGPRVPFLVASGILLMTLPVALWKLRALPLAEGVEQATTT